MSRSLEIRWNGERFTLLPEKALWWPARKSLVVADVHIDKASSFAVSGIPLPAEAVARADLDRLSAIIDRFKARQLIVLGDFFHAAQGRTESIDKLMRGWRSRHAALDVLLVRGNHDRHAGDPLDEWNLQTVDEPFDDAGVFLRHVPVDEARGPVLAGHIHPAVRLEPTRSAAGGAARVPCFWFGRRVAVLPAFGRFTGCARIRPTRGDRVFLVGPDAVREAMLVGAA